MLLVQLWGSFKFGAAYSARCTSRFAMPVFEDLETLHIREDYHVSQGSIYPRIPSDRHDVT